MNPEIPLQRITGKRNTTFNLKKFDLVKWGTLTNEYDFSKPHRHNYFEILIFFKGGGLHEIDFTQYQIKSRSIHFVPANSVHLLRRDIKSDGATILFAEDFFYGDESFNRFFKNLSIYAGSKGHVLTLSNRDFAMFSSLFGEMFVQKESNTRESEVVIKSLLTLFLARSEQHFETRQPGEKILSVKNSIVEKYKTLVELHLLEHISVKDYAEKLHISPKHLNDLCKQHLSCTAQKVIHERLLLEIKRLLVHTDLAIKEICYQTGFDDPAHFNHFFRFHMNLTPLQYRKTTR